DVRPGLLVSGIVEVMGIGGVGRFERTDRSAEFGAVFDQPVDHGRARLAEPHERPVGDDALHFLPKIIEHVLRRVADTGFLLDARAASGVDNTARQRTRSAAVAAFQHQHLGSRVRGFDGGADSGNSETDDDDIRFFRHDSTLPFPRCGRMYALTCKYFTTGLRTCHAADTW